MLQANFIIDPQDLKKVVVPQPIVIKFINPSKIDFLGETGMKMAKAGFRFFITKPIAEQLIKDNIAIEDNEPNRTEIYPLDSVKN